MTRDRRRCRGVSAWSIALLAVAAAARPALASHEPRVTNGGYMQTQVGSRTVALPLEHTDVEAEVAAMVSAVRVTQRFVNPYARPIEAIYVFPLPHRAAVFEMTIKIGERTIRGVVKRREQAAEIYRHARDRGQTAALLEQERPNIFTQSLANIMPGDRIEVAIRYVEQMTPVGARYEFVFPMVVGPRYVGVGPRPARSASAGDGGSSGSGWAADSRRVADASRITPRLLREGLRPGHDISLRLRIDGGVPVQHLQVVTHRATVRHQGRQATVELDRGDALPNKDFVVRYQLAGARPDAALLAHRDRRGGHFLLTIQPQARMTSRDVAPREYVFVVDNSGSMSGFPLQQARAVVRRCLRALGSQDTFRIIKFAGFPDQLAPGPLAATAANVAAGVRYVTAMGGGGGTEFLPALELALRAPKDPSRSRIVVFISDGYVGYEQQILGYLRRHGGQSNLFALGVGSSVNRFLIDGMARIGGGEPFYLLDREQAASVVERLHATVSKPALTDIRVDWGGLAVRDVAPQAVRDLFGERPIYLVGRYTAGGQGTVTIRGRLAGRAFVRHLPVALPDAPDGANAAVPYLWARQQIASAMDLHDTDGDAAPAARRRVTRIALRYNLLSEFTSLVAVDQTVRNRGGEQDRVAVPLPLPQGVSQHAAPGPAYVTGSAHGKGGLGLRGTGVGHGSLGAGTIGLGSLGAVGRGGGGGSGVGYGYGVGRGLGRPVGRRAIAPLVVAAAPVVRGSLDKEIIRRIIRRHVNQVRHCYQRELQQDPRLQGRVTVRFTIGPTGQVVAARVASSTLNSAQVESCVTSAVRGWLFPAIKGGGVVVVSYPFVFRPWPPGRPSPR